MGADVEGAETAVKGARPCEIEGCKWPRQAHGLCAAHRIRERKTGIRGGTFQDVRPSRGITLTDAGRAHLKASLPACGLCGARHRGPRSIAIVGSLLVVCYGAEYASAYMALQAASSLGVLRKAGAA